MAIKGEEMKKILILLTVALLIIPCTASTNATEYRTTGQLTGQAHPEAYFFETYYWNEGPFKFYIDGLGYRGYLARDESKPIYGPTVWYRGWLYPPNVQYPTPFVKIIKGEIE